MIPDTFLELLSSVFNACIFILERTRVGYSMQSSASCIRKACVLPALKKFFIPTLPLWLFSRAPKFIYVCLQSAKKLICVAFEKEKPLKITKFSFS